MITHHPLSEGARSELQTEVDRLYGLFVEHIAAMRRIDVDQIRATEAGLYFGGNAVSAGLADAVGSLDTALADFSSYLNARSRSSPLARGNTHSKAVTIQQESPMNDPEVLPTADAAEAPALSAEAARQVAAQADAIRREVTQSAQAIAELCLIANVPEQAARFIAAGTSEADVRRALVDARAARSEAVPIHSTITPEAGAALAAHPSSSPIVQAIKKLIAKE